MKVALVGIGCRYPGSINNVEDFWRVLAAKTDAVTEIPENRWNKDSFYSKHRDKKGKTISRWGGFIDDFDMFDAPFFHISNREAEHLDPQQRMLLETTWEAFEDGGLVPENYWGKKVGVYVGGFTLDYKILQFGGSDLEVINNHTATGSMMTLLSNRISHAFNFKGPSMTIDTACSSSMVAVHLAVKALENGECEMAVAGGVLLNIAPQYTVAESLGGFLSPDGRCKAYDASANGYVRGEGVGIVLLKPLEKAIADGDVIYSVILSSGVNQDGNTNGITVPSGESQEQLIRETLLKSGINSREIQYVEAHGTGTPVGDPIEAKAIGQVYVDGRGEGDCLYVGSIKTNIGHTEAAAGVAGLIKASLCLRNQQILPNLHFSNPNPNINFYDGKFRVPTELIPWPAHNGPARAAVNSFGFGGTNAHLILERYEGAAKNSSSGNLMGKPLLFPLSARSLVSLKEGAKKLSEMMSSNEHVHASDIMHSLCFHRSEAPVRELFFAAHRDDMIRKLKDMAAENNEDFNTNMISSSLSGEPGIVFVFAGMGPQWWGMGQQLYHTEPVFRNSVDKGGALFEKIAGWSLLNEMLADESSSKMAETRISQPANFLLQIGLFEMWKSWGIHPSAIVGHSTGEIASLYASGIYDLEDAILITYHRSRLQQTLAGSGKMAALGCPESVASEYIKDHDGDVSIAAINSPGSVTISGKESALEVIREKAEGAGLFFKYLRVEIPFHSVMMEPIHSELLENLSTIKCHKAKTPLYSTVFGALIDGLETDAHYWWKNVRNEVRFHDAVNKILDSGFRTFLEISPHPTLIGSINETAHEKSIQVHTVHCLKRKEHEQELLYSNLGELYKRGAKIDWSVFCNQQSNFVKLPLYAWNQEQHWCESLDSRRLRLGLEDHPILGHRLNQIQFIWTNRIDIEKLSYLNDHCIQGNVLFPAAGYICMALEALKKGFGSGCWELSQIDISRALFLDVKEPSELQLRIDPKTMQFSVETSQGTEIRNMSSGMINLVQNTYKSRSVNLSDIWKEEVNTLSGSDCYAKLREMGFHYGEQFRGIDAVQGNSSCCAARIAIPTGISSEAHSYVIHPVVVDLSFQAFITLELMGEKTNEDNIRLPVSLGKVCVYGKITDSMYVHVKKTYQDDKITLGDIFLYTDEGELVAEFLQFRVQSMSVANTNIAHSTLDKWLYNLNWISNPNKKVPELLSGGISTEFTDTHWAIFTDADGFGKIVADLIVAKGGTVSLAYCLAEESNDTFPGHAAMLNSGDVEGIKQFLLNASSGGQLNGIFHFWSMDYSVVNNIDLTDITLSRDNALMSLLSLFKALNQTALVTKVWAGTRGAVHITGDGEGLSILQSPLWGMARLIANQEYVSLWGGIVDFDPIMVPRYEDEASRFLEEVQFTDSEDQIAFRNRVRFTARLKLVDTLTYPVPPVITSNATYLVTGSFGSLGLLTIKWLISKGARNFILTSTFELPQSDLWESLPPDSKGYDRVAFLKEIEGLGVSYEIAVIDMCDEAGWEQYISNFRIGNKPPLKGVINIAGTVKDQLIANMTKEVFDAVYNPKALGSFILHRIFLQDELDFFICYSSIASLVTSSGQVNYAAGNAFIDALMQYRRLNGMKAMSIGWGPWAVGMIKDLHLEELYLSRGMEVITPSAGMQVLERVMNQDVSSIAVVSADWRMVIDSGPKASTLYLDHLAYKDGDSVVFSDAERLQKFKCFWDEADDGQRSVLVFETFQSIVAKVLHISIDSIVLSSSLSSLGMDSMMAIELKNRVELNIGAVIQVVDLLSGSTIEQLVGKIYDTIDSSGTESGVTAETSNEILDSASEEDLTELLKSIEGLSDEDAERMLENN